MQISMSMREHPRGKPSNGTVAQMKRNAAASETDDGGEDGGGVARAGVAPHAAVEAERDEDDVAGDEHAGSERSNTWRCQIVPCP